MNESFFAQYAAAAEKDRGTIWGPFRCVDGLHLALFALGKTAPARALLEETLDLIEESIRKDLSHAGEAVTLTPQASFPDALLPPRKRSVVLP